MKDDPHTEGIEAYLNGDDYYDHPYDYPTHLIGYSGEKKKKKKWKQGYNFAKMMATYEKLKSDNGNANDS